MAAVSGGGKAQKEKTTVKSNLWAPRIQELTQYGNFCRINRFWVLTCQLNGYLGLISNDSFSCTDVEFSNIYTCFYYFCRRKYFRLPYT